MLSHPFYYYFTSVIYSGLLYTMYVCETFILTLNITSRNSHFVISFQSLVFSYFAVEII